MKTKQINIKHPKLGEIEIYSEIPNNILQRIGDVTFDYSKELLFYHADITKNNDGTFDIKNLSVIMPESINVGHMDNKKGCKNFITVITNRRISKDITVYPSSILSVIYNQ